VRTIVGPLGEADLRQALAAAAAAARADLGQPAGGDGGAGGGDRAAWGDRGGRDGGAGQTGADGTVTRGYAELRYQGQEHTLEIPLPDSMLTGTGDGIDELAAAFGQRCQEAYAFRLDAPLEVVSVRVSVTAPAGSGIAWAGDDDAGEPGEPGEPGGFGKPGGAGRAGEGGARTRQVDFDQYGGVLATPLLRRAAFLAGQVAQGPCIVTEPAATPLVLPGPTVRRDDLGNLVIEEATS